MTKNILLTGATGFLGSYLAVELLRRGHRVHALSRAKGPDGYEKRLFDALAEWTAGSPEEVFPVRLTALEGDVEAPGFGLTEAALRRLQGLGVEVLHCAACTSFSETTPDVSTHANVVAAKNLLPLCARLGARALHLVSTAYVAGDCGGLFSEGDLAVGQGFTNDYEKSKHVAEALVRSFAAESGLPLNVFRPSIIMGESATGRTTNFNTFYPYFRILASVKSRFEDKLSRDGAGLKRIGVRREDGVLVLPLRIAAEPTTQKNIVPVDFVAAAVAALVERRAEGTATFHLTDPEPPTLARLNDEFNAALGVKGIRLVDDSAFGERRANFLEELVGSATRVYKPYLQREPRFGSAATHTLLRALGVPFPDLRESYYRKLVEYAVSSDPKLAKEQPLEDAVSASFFRHLRDKVGQPLVPNLRSLDTRFSIRLTDVGQGYSLSIERGVLTQLVEGAGPEDAFSFVLASDTLGDLIRKRSTPQEAFFESKVAIEGDMERALTLAPVFEEFFALQGEP